MTDLGLTFKITHFMRIGKIIARPFFGSAHLLDFLPNLGGIMHTKKTVPLYDLRHSLICNFFYRYRLYFWVRTIFVGARGRILNSPNEQ